MKGIIGSLLIAVGTFASHADTADAEYSNAVERGADAALNIFVHDEQGMPVSGAAINYAYWFRDLKHSLSVTGITDRTGH